MKELNVLSFGAGTQSTALLLMYLNGEWKQDLDYIIFADTGAEKEKTIKHLDNCIELAKNMSEEIHIAKNGNIVEDIKSYINGDIKRVASTPFFTLFEGKKGMLPRQCTFEYKVMAVRKKIAQLEGKKDLRGYKLNLFMGISVDEISRAKESQNKNTVFYYPLLDMQHDRSWCIEYVEEKMSYIPPSSECYMCPFQENQKYREMKKHYPNDWNKALEIDKLIRKYPKMYSEVYMHKSLKPLDQVDLQENQLSLFSDFCDGMCGL